MRRLVVLEVNEIPLRLLRWYADLRPGSTLAELLATAAIGRTEVREDLVKELYPSQTWASMAMGVPYAKHGVYWYGDPKPAEFPLYWQAAAEHRSVGIVGTLHSSPLNEQCAAAGMVFAVPDAFAPDPSTLPPSVEGLQSFNLSMTRRNARAVRSRRPSTSLLPGAAAALRSGIRIDTATRLGALVGGVATGRTARERLRTGQFVLMGDVFERLARRTDPDLAVNFTNHVAAAMHRYWYASFPGDWSDKLYGDDWVHRFRGEIPAAMDALDRFLGRMVRWCRASDRTLVLISSMGQTGGSPLESTDDHQLVIDEPLRFLDAVGIRGAVDVRHCMVPHVTASFADVEAAVRAGDRLDALSLEGRPLDVDVNELTVTWTYHLVRDGGGVTIDGTSRGLAELGIRVQPIEDHRCGVHDPVGTIIVANSPTVRLPDDPVDYLEVAPAILTALGVDPLPHHVVPTVTI